MRFRSRVLSLIMILSALTFITAAMCACAKPIQPNVPGAEAAVTLQALDVLKQAGKVATAIRDFEREQVAKGLISPAQDQTFQYNFAKLQTIADTAIDAVVAKTASIRQAAQSILDAVNGLLLDGQAALKALVDGLKSLLQALRGGTISVPVLAQ